MVKFPAFKLVSKPSVSNFAAHHQTRMETQKFLGRELVRGTYMTSMRIFQHVWRARVPSVGGVRSIVSTLFEQQIRISVPLRRI